MLTCATDRAVECRKQEDDTWRKFWRMTGRVRRSQLTVTQKHLPALPAAADDSAIAPVCQCMQSSARTCSAVRIFQHAFRAQAGHATCAVHARIARVCAAVRVGDELLSGEIISLEIAASQLQGGDHELPGHAHRQRLLGCIQHIHVHIGDGRADRHGRPSLVQPHIVVCSSTSMIRHMGKGPLQVRSWRRLTTVEDADYSRWCLQNG